ncbi:MAG: prepilin-type N-terminal cleavage/methylation domain-containing protein [Candidatus Omnitrophica bacterium]|nr:prepilin-type N-terminal cleavage/methylation domain-containing protein [Candidatus Omnitrophota bacterium]
MFKRGMTLLELLIALVLAGVIFLAIFHISNLTSKQINIYMERYNAYNQLGYALEDMAIRIPSASRIYSVFGASNSTQDTLRTEMHFVGSRDVYNITPYEGDTEYWYGVNNTTGNLVLEDRTLGKTEILVESKFRPYVEFIRTQDSEPDFCTVVVAANCSKSAAIGLSTKVVKAEGIKFWFVDIVAPN